MLQLHEDYKESQCYGIVYTLRAAPWFWVKSVRVGGPKFQGSKLKRFRMYGLVLPWCGAGEVANYVGFVSTHKDLPRKPATRNYRQLSPNFLLLWDKVAHYYG